MTRMNRREVLKAGSAAAIGAFLTGVNSSNSWAATKVSDKLPVAGVVTEYRVSSHADVILGKILEGYQQDGGDGPGLRLVSLYTDQVPSGDYESFTVRKAWISDRQVD